MNDEISSGPSSIVKVAAVLLLGVIFLSGLSDGVHSQMVDSITFTFNGQPTDGDTVTISGHVFEFDDDGSVIAGHNVVLIGSTVSDTISNFNTAVGGV